VRSRRTRWRRWDPQTRRDVQSGAPIALRSTAPANHPPLASGSDAVGDASRRTLLHDNSSVRCIILRDAMLRIGSLRCVDPGQAAPLGRCDRRQRNAHIRPAVSPSERFRATLASYAAIERRQEGWRTGRAGRRAAVRSWRHPPRAHPAPGEIGASGEGADRAIGKQNRFDHLVPPSDRNGRRPEIGCNAKDDAASE
jgi:hypothetical protein